MSKGKMNCKTCFWNVKNICENTDWKTGAIIDHTKEPSCGYFQPKKPTSKPLGWKIMKDISNET